MRMIWVFIFLLMPALHAQANETCESRLETSVAKVTERELIRGNIEANDVQDMVDSAVPLNPLRNRVPLPEIAKLAEFYALILPRVQNWEAVRGELRAVLQRFGLAQTEMIQAQAKTEMVWAGAKHAYTLAGRVEQGPYTTKSGRTIFATVRKGSFYVYDVASEEPLWSGQGVDQVWLTEDAAGEPLVRESEAPGRLWFDISNETTPLAGRMFAHNYYLMRRQSNGELRRIHSMPLQVWVHAREKGGAEFSAQQLRNGKLVAASFNPPGANGEGDIGFYAPFEQEPSRPLILRFRGSRAKFKIVEAQSGRVFVVAAGSVGSNSEQHIAIYEPALKGAEPIFTYSGIGTVETQIFEEDNHLYVALTDRDINGKVSTLKIFDPFESGEPFLVEPVERAASLAAIGKKGREIFALFGYRTNDTSYLSSFSLRGKTRP